LPPARAGRSRDVTDAKVRKIYADAGVGLDYIAPPPGRTGVVETSS
jgi:hypothetical protein